MSEPKNEQSDGKHVKEEPPKWPGGTNDPGKEFDDWLAESNRKADGG